MTKPFFLAAVIIAAIMMLTIFSCPAKSQSSLYPNMYINNDTIVPGTRDTIPLVAVVACVSDSTFNLRYVYREVEWGNKGSVFYNYHNYWMFVKNLDEKFDSLTCLIMSEHELPRKPKSYPSTIVRFTPLEDTIKSIYGVNSWFIGTGIGISISDTSVLYSIPKKFKAHAALVASYKIPNTVQMIKNCDIEVVEISGHKLWKIDGYRTWWPIAYIPKGQKNWQFYNW